MIKTQIEVLQEMETLSDKLEKLLTDGWQKDDDNVKSITGRLEIIQRMYFKPSPFRLGQTYRLMNGDEIVMVKVHNRGTEYESMADQYGCNRYTTRDFGRVTGTPDILYDKFIDLTTIDMSGFHDPSWWIDMFNMLAEGTGRGEIEYENKHPESNIWGPCVIHKLGDESSVITLTQRFPERRITVPTSCVTVLQKPVEKAA